ncbi:GAP1-N2 domain-containing protein [Nocardia sp. NPDC055165]
MVKQLQYSSVAQGMSGYAGFQYVASSPDAGVDEQQILAPYMSYRPPLDAPTQPADYELARFPVSLTYARAGANFVIAQSCYLGRDYSGRYGNYLSHGLIATEQELEGLRPIELWGSPTWPTRVAAQSELASLDVVESGGVLDPVRVQQFLASRGDSGYRLLGALLGAICQHEGAGGESIVLTANDSDDVARYIAALSYSLPTSVVTELSFTTYSGEPVIAHQRLVGTTPAVWESTRPRGMVFHLDKPGPTTADEYRRYVQIVVDAWRVGDFDRLDEVVETAEVVGEIDAAGAVCSFAHGVVLDPSELEILAGCLHRAGPLLPDSAWTALDAAMSTVRLQVALRLYTAADVERRPRLESGVRQAVDNEIRRTASFTDLVEVLTTSADAGISGEYQAIVAAARRAAHADPTAIVGSIDRCPATVRPALIDGACRAIAAADWQVRDHALTDDLCTRLSVGGVRVPEVVGLYLQARRSREAPYVGTEFLAELAARREAGTLVDGELARLISRLWRGRVADPRWCADLVAVFGCTVVFGTEIAAVLDRTIHDTDTQWRSRAELGAIVLTKIAEDQPRPTRMLTSFEDHSRFIIDVDGVLKAVGANRSPVDHLRAAYQARRRSSEQLIAQGVWLLARAFVDYVPEVQAELLDLAPAWHVQLVGRWIDGDDHPRPPADVVELVLQVRRLKFRSAELEQILRVRVRGKAERRVVLAELRRRDPSLERELLEFISGPDSSGIGAKFAAWKGRSGRE